MLPPKSCLQRSEEPGGYSDNVLRNMFEFKVLPAELCAERSFVVIPPDRQVFSRRKMDGLVQAPGSVACQRYTTLHENTNHLVGLLSLVSYRN